MVALVRRQYTLIARELLIGTGTTSALIQQETGLSVTGLLSGPLGGDLQIGALVATNQIKAVIFLRDPLTAHPHEPDIAALMKICDVYNVPLATNPASAQALLQHLACGGDDEVDYRQGSADATRPSSPLRQHIVPKIM